MLLSITPLAAQDLEEIGDYIAQDNPLRAVEFLTELQAHFETIRRNPEGYRLRQEFSKTMRSCSHGNYVIFYESDVKEVTIVRILYGGRDLPKIFDVT
jgi:toxin ParE1/3/4